MRDRPSRCYRCLITTTQAYAQKVSNSIAEPLGLTRLLPGHPVAACPRGGYLIGGYSVGDCLMEVILGRLSHRRLSSRRSLYWRSGSEQFPSGPPYIVDIVAT